MPATQAKVSLAGRCGKLLVRVAGVLLLAVIIGWLLQRSMRALEHSGAPAGFARGLLHGAMMPAALPNLLVGRDVPIYAANNTGLTYKLGYTMGVNGCGAIFFGFFYWRVGRWRKGQQLANAPPIQ
ncbi:MAG: hypothetical protein HY300_13805 [Verrucomicrobia bacterium]|nr:hypothetical protein [Verrucomicrobiota bacterium]